MRRFHPIEATNGFPTDLYPAENEFDYDNRFHQWRAKELAWRVQEELTEIIEASENGENSSDPMHDVLSEVADALHFLVELAIVVGFEFGPSTTLAGLFAEVTEQQAANPIRFPSERSHIAMFFWVGQSLGNAMNHLKNRPWKQRHRVTNKGAFLRALARIFVDFVNACQLNDITAEMLANAYFSKHEINQHRITSGV